VIVYSAGVRCVSDSVECECVVSVTGYIARVTCVSDTVKGECEVCQ